MRELFQRPLDEAEAWVRSRRPQVVMRPALRAVVAQAIDGCALVGRTT